MKNAPICCEDMKLITAIPSKLGKADYIFQCGKCYKVGEFNENKTNEFYEV